MTRLDDVDFNEVYFDSARVPAENLLGELNQGWAVANGSLGHERTMLWVSYAERLGASIIMWECGAVSARATRISPAAPPPLRKARSTTGSSSRCTGRTGS